MSFETKPNATELAEWFSSVKLHDKMDHAKYVGGIVCIENKQTQSWNPFPLASVRVAYMWDWVEVNGYVCHITTSKPNMIDLPFAKDLEAPAMFVEARIDVYKPAENLEQKGTLMRSTTGRKSVSCGLSIALWENRRKTGKYKKVPDFDALMKAETGAVARAAAMMGMLTLPGSGIASAEDIHEFMSQVEADESNGGASAAAGDGKPAEPPVRGGRAANPKAGRAVPAANDDDDAGS